MALSATRLRDAIRVAMLATPGIQAIDNAALTAFCSAIATAVVTEIQLATVTIPSGVAVATTGSAAAQVGETTAPGVGAIT